MIEGRAKQLIGVFVNNQSVKIDSTDDGYCFKLGTKDAVRIFLTKDFLHLTIQSPSIVHAKIVLQENSHLDLSFFSNYEKGSKIQYTLDSKKCLALLIIIDNDLEYYVYPIFSLIDICSWGIYGNHHARLKRSEDVAMFHPAIPTLGFLGDGISSREGWESREIAREHIEKYFRDLKAEPTDHDLLAMISGLQQEYNLRRQLPQKRNFGIYFLAFLVDQTILKFVRVGNVHLYLLIKDDSGNSNFRQVAFLPHEKEGSASALGEPTFANPKYLREESTQNVVDILILTDGANDVLTPSEMQTHLMDSSGLHRFKQSIINSNPSDDATAIRISFRRTELFSKNPFIKNHQKDEDKQRIKLESSLDRLLANVLETGDFDSAYDQLKREKDSYPQFKRHIDKREDKLKEVHLSYEELLKTLKACKDVQDLKKAIDIINRQKRDLPFLENRHKEFEDIQKKIKDIETKIDNFATAEALSEALTDLNSISPDIRDWIPSSKIIEIQQWNEKLKSIMSDSRQMQEAGKWNEIIEYLEKKSKCHPILANILKEHEKDVLQRIAQRNEHIFKYRDFLTSRDPKKALDYLEAKHQAYPALFLGSELDTLRREHPAILSTIDKISGLMDSRDFSAAYQAAEFARQRHPSFSTWLNPWMDQVKKIEEKFRRLQKIFSSCRSNKEAKAVLKEAEKDPDLKPMADEAYRKFSKSRRIRAWAQIFRKPWVRRTAELLFIVIVAISFSHIYMTIYWVRSGTSIPPTIKTRGEYALTVHKDGRLQVPQSVRNIRADNHLTLSLFPERFQKDLENGENRIRARYSDFQVFTDLWYGFLMDAMKEHIAQQKTEPPPIKATQESRNSVILLLSEALRVWLLTDQTAPSPLDDKEIMEFIYKRNSMK